MGWPFGDPWVLLAAVALDLAAGEPPSRFHPVAAMGWLIESLRKRVTGRGRWKPLFGGLGLVALGLGLSIGVGALVLLLRDQVRLLGLLAEVILLKMTFSVRGLAGAAAKVRRALAAGDLAQARRLLAWDLVSRDTAGLDEARAAAAAVESVAENTSDGVVAPVLWYLIGGLPAALAYRFANTADAMLGYRDAEREWLGKIPARLDDVLNVLPARFTAVFILLAAPLVGGRSLRGLKVWWSDARKTASPNAGHPMAAAAGALGIELEKIGCYRLGAGQRLPTAADIGRVVRLLYATVGLALVVVMGFAELPRLLRW